MPIRPTVLFSLLISMFSATYAAPIDQTESANIEQLESGGEDSAIPSNEPEGLTELKEARQALADGNLKLCQEKLRAAYAKSPNIAPPKLMLANLLLNGGQIDAGRRVLEEAAVSHPDNPELYVLFARLALTDGHATDAALHFDKALSMEIPSNWTDGQKAYLQRACLRGRTTVAERRGDWKEAAWLYQQQVDSQPKDGGLRDRFAMVLFHGGDLDRAFEQFDIAHLQDAAMNPPEISMAVMFVRKAEYATADAWFAKALAKHADQAAVHFEHSIAMLYQDRADQAAASAAKAAELGMRSPTFSMHRGLIAMQQGNAAAAETHFDDVLKQSPENAGAMTKLALVLIGQKDEAKRARAIELAEAAGKLHPNSPQAAAVLGWVYYRTDKRSESKNLLRAAAAQPASDPLPLFLYTRMLFIEQRTEDAQAAAKILRQQLEQPGLFVFRPAARRWLDSVGADDG